MTKCLIPINQTFRQVCWYTDILYTDNLLHHFQSPVFQRHYFLKLFFWIWGLGTHTGQNSMSKHLVFWIRTGMLKCEPLWNTGTYTMSVPFEASDVHNSSYFWVDWVKTFGGDIWQHIVYHCLFMPKYQSAIYFCFQNSGFLKSHFSTELLEWRTEANFKDLVYQWNGCWQIICQLEIIGLIVWWK